MDNIRIFTVLNSFTKPDLLINKSFMRALPAHINKFTLRTSSTDWQLLTKLKTGLQVKLQMTDCIHYWNRQVQH